MCNSNRKYSMKSDAKLEVWSSLSRKRGGCWVVVLIICVCHPTDDARHVACDDSSCLDEAGVHKVHF